MSVGTGICCALSTTHRNAATSRSPQHARPIRRAAALVGIRRYNKILAFRRYGGSVQGYARITHLEPRRFQPLDSRSRTFPPGRARTHKARQSIECIGR